MGIVQGTDSNFATEIKEGLVLVDFWAPWCGPCKMVAPVLEELSQEMGDSLKVLKINVDEEAGTAAEYQIMSIPTLAIFKDGKFQEQVVGFHPKEPLKELLTKYV